MSDMIHRVVVTGMGAITPVGNSVQDMWSNLLAGTSVTRRITRFDPTNFAVQIAAEVTDFKVEDYAEYIDRKEARRWDLFLQYCIAATAQAVLYTHNVLCPCDIVAGRLSFRPTQGLVVSAPLVSLHLGLEGLPACE